MCSKDCLWCDKIKRLFFKWGRAKWEDLNISRFLNRRIHAGGNQRWSPNLWGSHLKGCKLFPAWRKTGFDETENLPQQWYTIIYVCPTLGKEYLWSNYNEVLECHNLAPQLHVLVPINEQFATVLNAPSIRKLPQRTQLWDTFILLERSFLPPEMLF